MPPPYDGVGPDPQAVARPWLGSYPPGVPPTYRYPDVLLTRFLDDAVRDFPGATAVDAPGVRLTYPELTDVVDRLAGALEGLGVAPRRPLGLLLDRGPAWTVACFAAWRLGAAVVPVDPVRADPEVHRRLAATGVRVLLTAPQGIDRIDSIRGALPRLVRTITTTSDDWASRPRRLVRRLLPRGGGDQRRITARDDVLRLRELLETAPARSAQRHADGWDTAAVLFDADGLALPFSHRHLVAAAFQSRLWVPDVQAGRERILVAGPADSPHALVAGLLDPVLSAATVVVAPAGDADAVAEAIEGGRPTLLRGPAELFGKLAASSADLSSLRASLAVSGSLDGDTVGRFAVVTRGARLRRAYGPTAGAGLTHANPVYGRASADAIGLPVSDTLACLVDRDDPERPVPVGEVGRLLVRGPQVTHGRWRGAGDSDAPEELADAGAAAGADASHGGAATGGWFDTGDVARVDADGWFTLETGYAPGAHGGGPGTSDGTLDPAAGGSTPAGEDTL